MFLAWQICHHDGREKGWLDERSGGEVTGALNGQRTATVTAPLEGIAQLIHPGRTRLKVFCHPEVNEEGYFLLFNGLIQQPRSLGKTVEISAVDVSGRLLAASPGPFPVSTDIPAGAYDPIEDEESEILWEIIDRSDARTRELILDAPSPDREPPEMGIIRGEITNTGNQGICKLVDGETTWDILTKRASRNRAPDFDFRPLDRDDGVFAALDTHYPRMGRDRRDEVILEYGFNLSDFSYEPSGVDICNRYVLIGTPPSTGRAPVYVAEVRPSIVRHGLHTRVETAGDAGTAGELRRRAEDYVAQHAFQTHFVDATPTIQVGGTAQGFVRDALGVYHEERDNEWGVAPAFGPPGAGLGFDYWLGDEVTIRAKDQFNLYVDRVQPGPATDMFARVIDFTYREIDKDANVLVSHSLTPAIPAAQITGFESVVNTRTGSTDG